MVRRLCPGGRVTKVKVVLFQYVMDYSVGKMPAIRAPRSCYNLKLPPYLHVMALVFVILLCGCYAEPFLFQPESFLPCIESLVFWDDSAIDAI